MNIDTTNRKFVRPAEFAQYVGVSRFTIQNWVRDGVIPSTKVRNCVLIDTDKAILALEQFRRNPSNN